MLDAAARFGPEKMIFICLWNGKGGDGPGGAKHLMDEARAQDNADPLAGHPKTLGLRVGDMPVVLHDHAVWPQADPGRTRTRAGRDRFQRAVGSRLRPGHQGTRL